MHNKLIIIFIGLVLTNQASAQATAKGFTCSTPNSGLEVCLKNKTDKSIEMLTLENGQVKDSLTLTLDGSYMDQDHQDSFGCITSGNRFYFADYFKGQIKLNVNGTDVIRKMDLTVSNCANDTSWKADLKINEGSSTRVLFPGRAY